MLPLFDMLANAQNGQAMEALARQFNLTQQQTQAAVEALLPAFSQGLKRNASDPWGVGGLHERHGERPARQVFRGREQGLRAAGRRGRQRHTRPPVRLEGTVPGGGGPGRPGDGLGQQLLQQMLPVIASMIMGGLFKQSTNQLQAGGSRRQQSARRDHRADDAAGRRRRQPAAAASRRRSRQIPSTTRSARCCRTCSAAARRASQRRRAGAERPLFATIRSARSSRRCCGGGQGAGAPRRRPGDAAGARRRQPEPRRSGRKQPL